MTKSRFCASVIGIFFNVLLANQTAHAGLFHELSTEFGSGSIWLASRSGSDLGDVNHFEFNVTSFSGSPQTYTLNDIASVSWSIDDQWVLSLELLSEQIFFAPNTISQIHLSTAKTEVFTCGSSGVDRGSTTCVRVNIPGGTTMAFDTDFDLVTTSVPEPYPFALIAIMLSVLGLIRQRRSNLVNGVSAAYSTSK